MMSARLGRAKFQMRHLKATPEWQAASMLGAEGLKAALVDAAAARWIAQQDDESALSLLDVQDMIEACRDAARELRMTEGGVAP